jgi:predicted outer membrane repeat protein
MKHIHIRAVIFVLTALFLNGCSNVFFEKPQTRPGPEASSPDTPDGFGTIRVSFSLGAARTVIPDPVELNVLYLEYWFSKDGGTEERKDPQGDIFVLDPGNYNLTIKGFLSNVLGPLVTQGEAAPFIITAGTAAETVNVTLRPIVSGEGTGTLAFGLRYPAGVTVSTLTLTRIGGTESYNLLSPAPSVTGTNPLTMDGSRSNIPVGYFLLQAGLINSAGNYAGKTEVVHIYRNLTASTALADYTFTSADFSAYRVINANDAGAGSLRQAIIDSNTLTGITPVIQISLPPGSVIELQSPLPNITKSLILEGNGVTLTRAASASWPNYSHLLYINSSDAEVTVRRMNFKDGYSYGQDGGAILNTGVLTLESCIFSGNHVNGYGGAIYSYTTLTVRGCTFYENTATVAGAIGFGGVLTLEGNLFYRNTASEAASWLPGGRHPVVYVPGTGTVIASSYNVVDFAFGTGDGKCGWDEGTGDKLVTTLSISLKTFKLLSGSGATGVITTRPSGYPTVDFYGNPINTTNAAAGAVQSSTVQGIGYYYLDLFPNDSQWGTVTASPSPDEDGLYPAAITLTATPNLGYDLGYWLVNGVNTEAAPTNLTTHTQIQAVFGRSVTVDNFTDTAGSETTPGTLRYALTNLQKDDIISFSGVIPGTTVIEFQGRMPTIDQGKSLTINGNGITLTRSPTWTPDYYSNLLYCGFSDVNLTIRRVHFKNGLTTMSGAAIHCLGSLTLESCIFSDNHVTGSGNADGGVIYHSSGMNDVTIRGCTFYGNTAEHQGGAIYNYSRMLTLTGNIFYANGVTYYGYPVVRCSSANVNASYNVVDVAFGTGDAQTGWTAGIGDTTFSDLSISGDPFDTTTFEPVNGLRSPGVLPSAPADFPTTDFYGNQRTFPGAPGAVN